MGTDPVNSCGFRLGLLRVFRVVEHPSCVLCFDLPPLSFQLFEAHLLHLPSGLRDPSLHRLEPPRELVVRLAQRGYDPREFTFIPFGGMGPTIAGKVAMDLGIRRILIPRDPGTFSAYGMLVTDIQQERSVTRLTPLAAARPEMLESLFRDLEEKVAADLSRENVPRGQIKILRFAGMRYSELLGQILLAAVERLGITAKPAATQTATNGNGHAVAAGRRPQEGFYSCRLSFYRERRVRQRDDRSDYHRTAPMRLLRDLA